MNWDMTGGMTKMTVIIGGDGETTAAPGLTSRALLERMLNGLAVLKTVTDEDGRPVDLVYVDVNEAFESILGFRKEDVLGRTVTDVIPGWKWDSDGPVIPEGQGLKVDTYIRQLEKWLTTYTYVPQEGYLVSFFEDISERKQAEAEQAALMARYQEHSRALEAANAGLEAALARAGAAETAFREAKERAERYLDVAGVMLVMVAADGTVSMINKKGCEILGYEEKDLVGRNWFDIMVPPAERDGRIRRLRSLLSDRVQSSSGERTIIARDGTERLIAFNMVAVTDADGETCGILASGEDITELRKTRERLQHSRTLASLGEMTAGIAHEVNNPLGSILLHSELMLREGVAQEAVQDLRIIHDEAKRAARIMTDLLTYSQQHGTEERQVDLNEIIEEVVGLRAYTHSLKCIQTHLALEEGRVFVEGDRSQMMQLFLNLIQNAEEAVKERPLGEIHVTTRLEGGWAKASVADNGTGIPVENLKQIFYPFFTSRRTAGGTGLGLSTCHGIVTAHQGLIYADNNDMGGATLTVELPLAKLPKAGRTRNRKETREAA